MLGASTSSDTFVSFPSGWFLIACPDDLVLTASTPSASQDAETQVVFAPMISAAPSLDAYATQLWTHSDGFIVNRATAMALDTKNRNIGENVSLTLAHPRPLRATQSQMFILCVIADPSADKPLFRISLISDESLVISPGSPVSITSQDTNPAANLVAAISSVFGGSKRKNSSPSPENFRRIAILSKSTSKSITGGLYFRRCVLSAQHDELVSIVGFEDAPATQVTLRDVDRLRKRSANAKSWMTWLQSLAGPELPPLRIARFPDGEFFIGIRSWGRSYVIGVAPSTSRSLQKPSLGSMLELQPLSRTSYRSQLWRFRDDGKIENVQSELVMDVCDHKLVHGARIIAWHPKTKGAGEAANQTFVLGSDGCIMLAEDVRLVLGVGSPLPTFDANSGGRIALSLYRRDAAEDRRTVLDFMYPIFGSGGLCGWEDKEGVVVDDNALVINVNETGRGRTTKVVIGESGYSAVQASRDSDTVSVSSTHTAGLTLEPVTAATYSSSTLHEEDQSHEQQPQYAMFPSDPFMVFFKKHGTDQVLTVLLNECDDAEQTRSVMLKSVEMCAKIKNQLWIFLDGFLVNLGTNLVLDVVGSTLDEGSLLTASKRRARSDSASAQFGLMTPGRIFFAADEDLMVSICEDGVHVQVCNASQELRSSACGLLRATFSTKTVSKITAMGEITNVLEVDYECCLGVEELKLQNLILSDECTEASAASWITSAYALSTRRKCVSLVGMPAGTFMAMVGSDGRVMTLRDDGTVVCAKVYEDDAGWQLWKFDASTGRIINCGSGRALEVNQLNLVASPVSDSCTTRWGLTVDSELVVRDAPGRVVCTCIGEDARDTMMRVLSRDDIASEHTCVSISLAETECVGNRWMIRSWKTITHWVASETVDVRTSVSLRTRTTTIEKRAHFPGGSWCVIYCLEKGKDLVLDAVEENSMPVVGMRKFELQEGGWEDQMWMWEPEDSVWVHRRYPQMVLAPESAQDGSRLILSARGSSLQRWQAGGNAGICLDAVPSLYMCVAEGDTGSVHLRTIEHAAKCRWGFRILSGKIVVRRSSLMHLQQHEKEQQQKAMELARPRSMILPKMKDSSPTVMTVTSPAVRKVTTITTTRKVATIKIMAAQFPSGSPFFIAIARWTRIAPQSLLLSPRPAQTQYFVLEPDSHLPNAKIVVKRLDLTRPESQLWTFDGATRALVNRASGLSMSVYGGNGLVQKYCGIKFYLESITRALFTEGGKRVGVKEEDFYSPCVETELGESGEGITILRAVMKKSMVVGVEEESWSGECEEVEVELSAESDDMTTSAYESGSLSVETLPPQATKDGKL
ncbi:hypothetical protein BJ742DRAFT_471741 [Cladochytrium replicatum]|nr:hypothetical protein BJ742DRAFT_471741 [Cladochytrium replicatum]